MTEEEEKEEGPPVRVEMEGRRVVEDPPFRRVDAGDEGEWPRRGGDRRLKGLKSEERPEGEGTRGKRLEEGEAEEETPQRAKASEDQAARRGSEGELLLRHCETI